MKKYKVCVYAITKNEEKFVDRWYQSMKEADEIYVLDTGSKDKTVKLLKKHGVKVKIKKIKPWRFDVARNESLNLVPKDTDICVCTDLDEVFTKGWRKELEDIWDKNMTRLAYNYNWHFDEYGNPDINYYIQKIHNRNNYKWTHPVHEVLTYIGNDKEIIKYTDNFSVNHYPDKSKSRGSYLSLLELSVKEDSEDDRNMHYLGREYMYYKRWNEAIDTLIKHLGLKKATWKDERSASMRFISRCYINLGRIEEARMWLDKAIKETPYLRDPYVERGMLEYNLNNFLESKNYLLKALEIKSHEKTYINEVFSWNNTIYDLLSICCYNLKEYEDSYKYVKIANEMNPKDKRIKNNVTIIENKIKELRK